MKKCFMMLLTGALLAGFTACEKAPQGGDNNGSIIDNGDDNGQETPTLHASLQGSEYYVLCLDEDSFNAIASKVVVDARVNDETVFLYDWAGAYNAGTASGTGFYGGTGWLTYEVGTQVSTIYWSGGAYCIKADTFDGMANFKKIAEAPEDYYLHFAYKPTSTAPHALFSDYNAGNRHIVGAIGEGEFNDNGTIYPNIKPLSGSLEQAEWNEYEISIEDLGVDFSADVTGDVNIFAFLSGGTAGVTLDLDAIFIYKK